MQAIPMHTFGEILQELNVDKDQCTMKCRL